LVDNPTLFILSGEDAGGAFALRADANESRTWTIGRQDDRDICLNDDGVSANHAELKNNG
jgi:pSer/pThr/pTyr-binding forkhead associated (FHA) protein